MYRLLKAWYVIAGRIYRWKQSQDRSRSDTNLPSKNNIHSQEWMMNAVYVESIGIGELCTTDQVLVKTNCDQCQPTSFALSVD